MQQLRDKGVWPRSRDLGLNFGTHLYLWTAEATNFKFGMQIDYNRPIQI